MGENLNLPPGFKFHPTDEELITFYLVEKFRNQNFNPIAIGEANLNSCEPWDLSSQAKMKEKELYFFFKRDKKYPTGTRTNRATASGYWKATGKDKEIFHGGKPPSLMGMKKTLVFYQGRAPRGKKTNWVMHEYRLEGKSPGYDAVKHSKDEWVVCRVFEKGTSPKTKSSDLERIDSFGDFFDDRFSYDGDCGIGKATPAATVNPSYPGHVWSGFPSQEFIFYSQGAAGAVGHLPSSSANASFMHPHGNFGYPSEPTASAFRSQPKTEQHSNHSFVSASQDTGLSTDRYTEISSVISKSDGGYHSSSANPADDFVGLWEC